MKKQLAIEKEEVIEMMTTHLQNQHSISPLCGKIWATLIIEGKSAGLTFDYLVERLQASKSSISTHLNFLLKTDKIYFFTIEGDRKKHFRAFPFSERFERLLKNMEFEKKLIDKIIDYKNKEEVSEENKCALDNIIAYKGHLSEMERLTIKIIHDLKQIELKNTNN